MPGSIFDNLKPKMNSKQEVQESENTNDKTGKILSSIGQNNKGSAQQQAEGKPMQQEQDEPTIGGAFSNFSKQASPEKQGQQEQRVDSHEVVKELEEKARMAAPFEKNNSEKKSDFSSEGPVQVGDEESVLPDLPEKKPVDYEQQERDSQNTINKQYFGDKVPEETDYYKPAQNEAQLAKEIIDPRAVEKTVKKKEESKLLNMVVFVLILVGIAVLSAIWFYFFGG